jgi:WD40 repeat protein/type 1 glutamine amidotransferase
MKRNLPIIWGLVFATSLLIHAQPAAIVSNMFPPPQDIRAPDVTITNAAKGDVSIVAYDSNGRFLATASDDNIIRTWEARPGEQETGALIHSFAGHTNRIMTIWFGAETNSMVSVSKDGTVKAWDYSAGKLLRSLRGNFPSELEGAAFLPGTNSIMALAGGDQLELRNYKTGELLTNLDFPFAGGVLDDIRFSPDGKILAVAGSRGAVALLDWRTDTDLGSVGVKVPGEEWVDSMAFSETNFAIGSSSGDVRVWKIGDWENAREFSTGTTGVCALAFSPKGDQLASGSEDGTVKVWDVETGTLLCTQQGHNGVVNSVTFASNGQKMASGGADGTARLWTVPLPPIPPGDLEKIKAALPAKATAVPKKPRRILVFWRADAILHKGGVPAANAAIELMGKKTGAYETDFSRNYEVFNQAILSNYDAIVMNSTAHLAMPDYAKQAYLDYVKGGGGVIGIHAAIDTFHDWLEGAKVIGATFGNHPWHPDGTWAVKLEEPGHPLLRAFGGKNFTMHDEFYEMAGPYSRSDRRVLLTVDLSDPATAGVEGLHRTDKDFALAWIKKYGEGRVFYCDFGHTGGPFQNPAVLQFYLDGIQYVLGDLEIPPSDAVPK